MFFRRAFCLLAIAWALPLFAQLPEARNLKTSLVFEPNQGQAPAAVQFLSHGNGHNFLLTGQGATLTFADPATTVNMQLIGENPSPQAQALERQSGVTHYFRSNDPADWIRGVPQFKRVRYSEVYPGINLIYYGSETQLEYDFEVAPYAEPDSIALRFDGVESLSIDTNGDLILHTPAGEIRHQRPIAFQQSGDRTTHVAAEFVVEGNRVSFNLGKYDRSKSLVIDPTLVWSSYLGGSGDDQGNDVAVDSNGNAYVTGFTVWAEIPTGTETRYRTLQPGANDLLEAFVTKIDSTGVVVYSTYFGGTGNDEAHSIALDSVGNIYLTGYTTSSDFPVVNGFQSSRSGTQDAYVLKLNNTGDAILYSTYLGGSLSERGYGIAVDAAGNVVVAGSTFSSDFPVSNAFQPQFGGGLGDAFITQIMAGGSKGFSTFLGGIGNDQAYDVAFDRDGNVVLTGFTTSSNFPVSNPLYANYRGGTDDAFVTKMTPTGSGLVFSTYLGGSGSDNAVRLTIDKDQNIIFTGYTTSGDFPLKNPAQLFHAGVYDAFLIKLDPDGQDATFSTFIGGEDTEGGVAVATDPDGFIYLAGFTNSLSFYAINAVGAFLRGARDGFVIKIAPDASSVVYSTYLGGFGLEGATGIAVDSAGNAYVTGYTLSGDFPVAENAFQPLPVGGQDGFIVKIDASDVRTAEGYVFPTSGGVQTSTAGQTAQPIFGYASVDVTTGLSPTGLEIVDLRSVGTLVNEVSIPLTLATLTARLAVSTTTANATALTMVNPNDEEIKVEFYFTSSEGMTSNYGTFALPAHAQTSGFLSAQPFNLPAEVQGTVTLTSTVGGPFFIIGLKSDSSSGMNPVNTYEPAINPSLANNHALVIPQFADGGGWTTQVVLVNPTDYVVTGQIRLFKNDDTGTMGIPAEIVTDRGVNSIYDFSIEPRGLYALVTQGEPEVVGTGFAEIIPSPDSFAPHAYARLYFTESGISAATVEGMEAGTDFKIYAEVSGTFPEDLAATPALALSNSSGSPATVNLSLTGFDGLDTGLTGQVVLPPKGHFSSFLATIPGFENLPSPFEGVLRLTTTDPGVTATGFRTRYNEQRQFLATATGPLKDLGNTNPLIFSHLIDGGGYATQFILINGASGAGASGTIGYRNASGGPLNISIAQ